MTMYVCYDIRGIQSFIFRIPKLKYIIGGSAIVDRFDRDFARNLDVPGVQCLFAGGGRGTFAVSDASKVSLLRDLVCQEAHRFGLDIRFGCSIDYSEASRAATDLYPFLPSESELDGQPCDMSGCYPVSPPAMVSGKASSIHPTVMRRIFDRGDKMSRRFEDRLLVGLDLGPELKLDNIAFLSNVDESDEDGYAGAVALGGQNRWAVIAMDGNDIGSQFLSKRSAGDLKDWVGPMSEALDACSFKAAQAGIETVVRTWFADTRDQNHTSAAHGRQHVIPVRPLVVGGDDLVVLCHARYAFDFVEAATRAFERESAVWAQSYARKHQGKELWPATGGRISISAGVLFASTKLPLHLALPYAELLLASAKWRGRMDPIAGAPSPASIDWEHATESLLDTPSDRRNRELRFADEDLCGQEVTLTCRPYTMAGFRELRDWIEGEDGLSELPKSLIHSLHDGLRAAFWDRQVFSARLGKNSALLQIALSEGEKAIPSGSRWSLSNAGRRTDILDAALIWEESGRMDREKGHGF